MSLPDDILSKTDQVNSRECLHCDSETLTAIEPSPRLARISALIPLQNNAPSFRDDQERIELQLRRGTLQKDDKEVLDEMRQLRSKYAEMYRHLQQKHATIQRDKADLRRVFNPLLLLPTEILSTIFVEARNMSAFPGSYDTNEDAPLFARESIAKKSLVCSPWNVSQVCRRWRSIAIAHAPLWTFIGLISRASTVVGGTRKHAGTRIYPKSLLAALQIARSRNSKLHIHLQGSADLDPALAALLVATAPRWKHIDLVSFQPISHIQNVLGSCLSSLESLHIAQPCATEAFYDAPHLSVISGIDDNMMSYKLPWKTIKTASIRRQRSDAPNSALKLFWESDVGSAAILRRLHINDTRSQPSFTFVSSSAPVPTWVVTLASLQELHIMSEHFDVLQDIKFTMPLLTSLSISRKMLWSDGDVQSLCRTIQRSCTVQRLSIKLTFEPPYDILELIQPIALVSSNSRPEEHSSWLTQKLRKLLERFVLSEFKSVSENGYTTFSCVVERGTPVRS